MSPEANQRSISVSVDEQILVWRGSGSSSIGCWTSPCICASIVDRSWIAYRFARDRINLLSWNTGTSVRLTLGSISQQIDV